MKVVKTTRTARQSNKDQLRLKFFFNELFKYVAKFKVRKRSNRVYQYRNMQFVVGVWSGKS